MFSTTAQLLAFSIIVFGVSLPHVVIAVPARVQARQVTQGDSSPQIAECWRNAGRPGSPPNTNDLDYFEVYLTGYPLADHPNGGCGQGFLDNIHGQSWDAYQWKCDALDHTTWTRDKITFNTVKVAGNIRMVEKALETIGAPKGIQCKDLDFQR